MVPEEFRTPILSGKMQLACWKTPVCRKETDHCYLEMSKSCALVEGGCLAVELYVRNTVDWETWD